MNVYRAFVHQNFLPSHGMTTLNDNQQMLLNRLYNWASSPILNDTNGPIKSIDQYLINGITYIIIGEFHDDTDNNLFDQFLEDICQDSAPFEIFLETPFFERRKYRFKSSLQNTQDLINKKKTKDSIRDIRQQVQRSDCQMRVHAVDIRSGTWAKSHETFAHGEIWWLSSFQIEHWVANYGRKTV